MGIGDDAVVLIATGSRTGLEMVDLTGAGSIDANLRPAAAIEERVFGGSVFGRMAGNGRDNRETEAALASCPDAWRVADSTVRTNPGGD